MKPWVAGLTFVLGLLLGLYAAHEADAELHRRTDEKIETLEERHLIDSRSLNTCEDTLQVQHAALVQQLATLESVCPIIRKAYARWAWCSPKEEP